MGRPKGQKLENLEKKPLESDWDQPILAHIQVQDWTRVAVVAGGMDDDHCTSLTPLAHPIIHCTAIQGATFSFLSIIKLIHWPGSLTLKGRGKCQ